MKRRTSHRLSNWAVYAVFAAAVILVGGGALGYVLSASRTADAPRDLAGNPIALDVAADPAPASASAKQLDVDAHTELRFAVPDVGLNVPLAEMNEVDHSITPPGFQDAYLIRNIGARLAEPQSGTVYVAMHSLRGGGVGPGNYLIDVARGVATVKPGEPIKIGALTYTVSSWETVKKTALQTDASIWSNVPGRLVVFSCLQVPAQTESTKNIIIIATLVPTAK